MNCNDTALQMAPTRVSEFASIFRPDIYKVVYVIREEQH